MARTKISEFSSTPANNTDIDSINISEGCAPSGINDAIRELMSQLKDFQTGSAGDPVTVGGVLTVQAGSASTPALTTSGDTNTGMFFPAADTIAFAEGGAEVARFDSGGNLGLGVTPSAWSRRAFQIAATSGDAAYIANSSGTMVVANNARYNSGDFYINSSYATYYAQQTNGAHVWANAPSGTAGNAITFTQAMTLDASGNLGLGTTSPSTRLHIVGSGNPTITLAGSDGAYSSIFNMNSSSGGVSEIAASQVLKLSTASNERARIDSSGNFLVGVTSTTPGNARGFSATSVGAGEFRVFHSTSDGSGDLFGRFIYNGSQIGSISQSGTTAVAYNTSSDYRLKNTIAPMIGALAKVALLKPCTYKWNADGSDGEGFIAHELAEVCPQAVTGEKDAVDEDGNPQYQGIDVSFLVATLTAAIQELKAEFDAYKASHP